MKQGQKFFPHRGNGQEKQENFSGFFVYRQEKPFIK